MAASVCSSTRDSHASVVMRKRKKVHGKEPTQEKPLTNFTPVSHLYKVMEGFCDGVSPPVIVTAATLVTAATHTQTTII